MMFFFNGGGLEYQLHIPFLNAGQKALAGDLEKVFFIFRQVFG